MCCSPCEIYVSHPGGLEKEVKAASWLHWWGRQVRRYEIAKEIVGRLWKHGNSVTKVENHLWDDMDIKVTAVTLAAGRHHSWQPNGWKAWIQGSLWIIFWDAYVCDLRSQWQGGRRKIKNASVSARCVFFSNDKKLEISSPKSKNKCKKIDEAQ